MIHRRARGARGERTAPAHVHAATTTPRARRARAKPPRALTRTVNGTGHTGQRLTRARRRAIAAPAPDARPAQVFLKFFAPWCGHCKQLAPLWQEVTDMYKGDEHRLVGEVDCTTEEPEGGGKALCEKFNVSGYPTLLYGDPDQLQKYTGERTPSGVKAHAEALGPSCEGGQFELCSEKKQVLLAKFQKMSSEELDKFIKVIHDGITDASGIEIIGKHKLQTLYDTYQADGEERQALVWAAGLAEAKDVQRSRAPVVEDEAAKEEL